MAEQFSHGDADASSTYPTQCSSLRRGGHVVLKGHPCKIVEMLTSVPGKHGHAKVHLVAVDVFTGRKYEDIFPASHKVPVPIIKRIDYQLVDMSDGYMTLLNNEGELREDLQVPKGTLGQKMEAKLERDEEVYVVVLQAMGEEATVGIRGTAKRTELKPTSM